MRTHFFTIVKKYIYFCIKSLAFRNNVGEALQHKRMGFIEGFTERTHTSIYIACRHT